MYVILVYDIKTDNGGQKVLNRTFKICKKYLAHIQKSVFEGNITEGQLKQLKNELLYLINPEEDAVCIYRFDSAKYAKKEEIGSIEIKSHII